MTLDFVAGICRNTVRYLSIPRQIYCLSNLIQTGSPKRHGDRQKPCASISLNIPNIVSNNYGSNSGHCYKTERISNCAAMYTLKL